MSSVQEVEDFVSPLKVTQLREELKKRNLSSSGSKSVLAQRLQEFLVKEKEQGGGDGPLEESAAAQEQEAAAEDQAEVGDTSQQVAESEEKDAEEAAAAEDSGKQGEQEEYEEVMDQIVQTEASGEAVSRAADPQPAQSEAPAQEESSAEQQEDQAPPSEQATEEQPPPQPEGEGVKSEPGEDVKVELEEEEGVKMEPEEEAVKQETEGEGEQPSSMEMEVDEQAPAEQQSEESQEEQGGTEEPCPQEGEGGGEAQVKQEKEETEPQPAKEKVEQHQSEERRGGGVKRHREDDRDWGRDRGDGRSRDRDRGRGDRPDPAKAPDPEEPEGFDESEVSLMEDEFRAPDNDDIVMLDKFNSDLHFKITGNGLGGCGLTDGGFANLWASARAQWGVKGGKYFYEVKVEENMAVDLPDTEEHPHAIRVGWSIDEAGLGLGEAEYSYGYGGTGKSVVNNHYNEYGETYGPGDTIGCFVDLESNPGSVSFSKNGNLLGTAFVIEEGLGGRGLFPHIATKNVRVSLNFSEPAWQDSVVEGYAPIQAASEDHRERAPQGPSSITECEVLMMVGLPASGKTSWAEKHCRQNPEKRYTILGTNLIMDKMKVSGLTRKFNYHTRWESLIKKATEVLNRMFLLAGKVPRNYIVDQTNVYSSAQRRKMGYFEGFQKKAVCVIPPHHELRKRTAKRNDEMGQSVPEDATNAMKANFCIPKAGQLFDDVIFSEIYGPAAAKIVQQYKEDALGIPSFPSSKRGRYDRGGGGRYGPPPRSSYPPHRSGYGSPYGYNRPPFPPYGGPPLPPMYPPRGGYRPRPSYDRPYPPFGPPPPRGGYYGRY